MIIKLVLPILRLRYIQARKMLITEGWVTLVLVTAVVLFISLQLSVGHPSYFGLFVVIIVWSYRKDKRFLTILTDTIYQKIVFTIEHLLILFPFLVLSFTVGDDFLNIFISVTITVIFSVLGPKYKIKTYKYLNINFFVSSINYEWKAGLRKNGITILILYVSFFISVFLTKIPYLFIFFVMGLIGIILKFYVEMEPPRYLLNRGVNSKDFIRRTSNVHFLATVRLIFPAFVCQIIMFDTMNGIFALLYGILLLFVCQYYLLINKYCKYKPQSYFLSNAVTQFLVILAFAFPVFVVIAFLQSIWRQKQAVFNLEKYF